MRRGAPQRHVIGKMAAVAGLAVAAAGAVPAVARAALPPGCTQSGRAVTCAFGFTGAEQTFVVPPGTTSLAVTAIGAAGGGGFLFVVPGRGGVASAGLAVTPGSSLYVEVGGVGGDLTDGGASGGAGGFNGGGRGDGGDPGDNGMPGGGGASDVRTVSGGADPASIGLNSRLIVAGGGGGTGRHGSGGDAGQPGGASVGAGGQAGTQAAGGAGTPPGTDGTLGRGGLGGPPPDSTVIFENRGGGGGGGGLYGGGGGGNQAGGGGGSSYVPAGGTTGVTSDPASVVISYQVPYTFSGFLPPTVNPPAVNSGNSGRQYALEWQLREPDGAFVSALSAVTSLTYKPTNCAAFSTDPVGSIEAATSGGGLTYKAKTNTYQFPWKTPKATGCYTLFLTLDTGQVFAAFFSLR
ncbi:PxKF domain-containing protein [Krasilnikovia sp. MM14-A1004]|uniref:PxKF domain-containing protein n=1 Tax=Krasilnikovia sp. MM14-A1004 TaxID=3373541 RepID=UPI00399CB41B